MQNEEIQTEAAQEQWNQVLSAQSHQDFFQTLVKDIENGNQTRQESKNIKEDDQVSENDSEMNEDTQCRERLYQQMNDILNRDREMNLSQDHDAHRVDAILEEKICTSELSIHFLNRLLICFCGIFNRCCNQYCSRENPLQYSRENRR